MDEDVHKGGVNSTIDFVDLSFQFSYVVVTSCQLSFQCINFLLL